MGVHRIGSASYLYVYPRNLPPHGDKELFLPTDRMAETKHQFLAPPPPPVPVKDAEQAHECRKKKWSGRRCSPVRPDQPDDTTIPENSTADPELAAQQPSLVDPELALKQVWPYYEVRPYYDTGKTVTEDGKEFRRLVAMYPFTLYFSHDGPLFGFTHRLELVSGGKLEQLQAATDTRPALYKLTIPSEGVARLKTFVEAHEEPRADDEARQPSCGCSVPGWTAPLSSLLLTSLGVGSTALLRRRRRSNSQGAVASDRR